MLGFWSWAANFTWSMRSFTRLRVGGQRRGQAQHGDDLLEAGGAELGRAVLCAQPGGSISSSRTNFPNFSLLAMGGGPSASTALSVRGESSTSTRLIQLLTMRTALVGLVAISWAGASPAAAEPAGCGTRPGLERELRRAATPSTPAPSGSPPSAADDRDVDDVAILQDRGDLVSGATRSTSTARRIRLTPSRRRLRRARRWRSRSSPRGRRSASGTTTRARSTSGSPSPSSAPPTASVFVHTDGHRHLRRLRRGHGRPRAWPASPGRAAAHRRVLRATSTPPAAGRSPSRTEPARAVILWSAIPGAGQINRNTLPGRPARRRADRPRVGGACRPARGSSASRPGGGAAVSAVDWSAPRAAAGGGARGALQRDRAGRPGGRRPALPRRPRADVFHQVVVYTTRPLNPVPGTLAFEINVRNDVAGIGLEIMDHARDWGSAGVLESVVYMDSVDTLRGRGRLRVPRPTRSATAGSPGCASRRPATGRRARLLGRGDVHWSFFLDTDASVMEGNAIADRGDGRFETVDFARRFSPLDQYAMGLRAAAEVPPFFYVDAADDFRPNRPYKASSAPEAGVSASPASGATCASRTWCARWGRGRRRPAPPMFRQAFVLVADGDAAATEASVRARWPGSGPGSRPTSARPPTAAASPISTPALTAGVSVLLHVLVERRYAPRTASETRRNPVFARIPRAARPLLGPRQEDVHGSVGEIVAALSGVAIGVGAGRLFLEGVLSFAFRGR